MSVESVHRPPSRPGRRFSVSASTWAKRTARHVTVSVSGEVDASSAKDLAVAIRDAITDARRVTLDLSELEFFGLDGVAALHAVNAQLTPAGVPWCVLAGAAVTRVLDLCDPEGLIPVAVRDGSTPNGRARLRLVEPA